MFNVAMVGVFILQKSSGTVVVVNYFSDYCYYSTKECVFYA